MESGRPLHSDEATDEGPETSVGTDFQEKMHGFLVKKNRHIAVLCENFQKCRTWPYIFPKFSKKCTPFVYLGEYIVGELINMIITAV